MAKHDQRILKFLNQNADRAPTITEMMTRLNISISDISESLASLQAQGLISKKVDQQGIECWFPGAANRAVPSGAMSGLNLSDRMQPQAAPPMAAATAQMPAMGGPISAETRKPVDARSPFHNDMPERVMAAPAAQPPLPRSLPSEREARPVQVQHVAVAEPPAVPRGLDSSDRNSIPSIPQQPVFNGSAGMYGLAPASRGVGFFTLLAGLVAAVGLSSFITTRLIAKEFRKTSASFVDRKALTDANAALTDFQEKTKAHVAALEADVKRLSDELASSKAAAESSKVAVAATPAAAKEPAPAAKGGKAAKAAEAKPAEAHATAATTGSAKSAKAKKAVAAAKPKPSGATAMSKAAARGAAMRKKSAHSASHESGSDEGGSSESASSPSEPSSSASEAPSVPNPPGLDDLPPPPAE